MKSNKEKIIEIGEYILKKNYGEIITIKELNEFIQVDLSDEIGKRKFKRII